MTESLPVQGNRYLGGKKGPSGKKSGKSGKKNGGKGKKDTDLGNGDNYYDPDPQDDHYGSGKGGGKGGKGGKGNTGSTTPAAPDGNDGHPPSMTPGSTGDGGTDANGGSNGTGDTSGGVGGFSIISSPAPTDPPTSPPTSPPTLSPTVPPTNAGGDLTDTALTTEECQAISDGLGPQIGTAMNYVMETDVVHTLNADVTVVLSTFNEQLQRVVAPQIAGCGSTDADEGGRKLLVLQGSIKNVLFGVTVHITDRRCETDYDTSNNKCIATDTKVAVYVSENRRALTEGAVVGEAADLSSAATSVAEIHHLARALAVNSDDVALAIGNAVQNANDDGAFADGGIVLANVTAIDLISVTDTDQATPQQPKVANVAQEVGASDDGGMQLRGILPLAFGLTALVLLLMCVVKRRRRSSNLSQHVYLEDDEDWKSEDNTEEEHSVDLGEHPNENDVEINRELHLGGMDTVDVHRCNSATCDTCNQRKQLEFLRVERSFASGLTDDAMKDYFDGGDLVAL